MAVDHKLIAHRAEEAAKRRWKEAGLQATIFTAEEVEIERRTMGLALQRVIDGHVRLTARDILRAAEFEAQYERERSDDVVARRSAEAAVAQTSDDLRWLLASMLKVAGEHQTYEVIREAHRLLGNEMLWRLPELRWAHRWYVEYLNGPRFPEPWLVEPTASEQPKAQARPTSRRSEKLAKRIGIDDSDDLLLAV